MLSVPGGWFCLDDRLGPQGYWRADDVGAKILKYRDISEAPHAAPWIPRDWQARDLPELMAPDFGVVDVVKVVHQ